MDDFTLQIQPPSTARQQFKLEHERMALEEQILAEKAQIAKYSKRWLLVLGLSVFLIGLVKLLLPSTSLLLLSVIFIVPLFDLIGLYYQWIVAKRRVRAWDEIMQIVKEREHKSLVK